MTMLLMLCLQQHTTTWERSPGAIKVWQTRLATPIAPEYVSQLIKYLYYFVGRKEWGPLERSTSFSGGQGRAGQCCKQEMEEWFLSKRPWREEFFRVMTRAQRAFLSTSNLSHPPSGSLGSPKSWSSAFSNNRFPLPSPLQASEEEPHPAWQLAG